MNQSKFSTAKNDEEHVSPLPVDGDSQDAAEDATGNEVHVAWLPEPPLSYRVIKRLIDIIGSLFLLVLFAPMFLVISLAIRLTSKGPIVFRQTRLGYRGKPFEFLKFRSMTVGHSKAHLEYMKQLLSDRYGAVGEGGVFKMRNDPRITPLGKFLRRTSLDEMPQFLNVLRGEMSLVGPRPPLMYEWEAYSTWHKQRLSYMPGITGLWQIHGRTSTPFDEMVRLDIEYLKHPSILGDIRILFRTVTVVALGDKAF